jgi:hypothetical protein
VLDDAQNTLKAAAHLYVWYSGVVRSVGAVRDDVEAGVSKPSPKDVNYLNAVCGSPARIRA